MKNTIMDRRIQYKFSAEIYLTGINWCVDVPKEISNSLIKDRGRINIKGKINEFEFKKTLMPVKNSFHRLFVNKEMMTGGKTALGKIATFEIEQDHSKKIINYPIPTLLQEHINNHNLSENFKSLTPSNRKATLKYLSFVKTEETMLRNINKIISQLLNNQKNIKIP